DGAPNYQAMGVLGRSAPMAPLFQDIYRNATGSLSWQTQTFSDLKAMGQVTEMHPVHGESCQWSINLPLFLPFFVNLDSSAYQAAYLQALRNGGVDAVVDVRADRSVMGVLGIYWKVCTVVNATGVKLADGSPMKMGPHTR
ncbi:MAG: hypothetical protein ACJ790_22335, partial [Myxococcaceae bacterium]